MWCNGSLWEHTRTSEGGGGGGAVDVWCKHLPQMLVCRFKSWLGLEIFRLSCELIIRGFSEIVTGVFLSCDGGFLKL